MLVSVEKQFIFVHVPKTGGTSLRKILAPHSLKPNRTRLRGLLSHLPMPEAPEKAWLRVHDTAYWGSLKLPREMFENYFKFAVVRNPYDYAVSYFEFQRGRRSAPPLMDAKREFLLYLQRIRRRQLIKNITQQHWLTDWQGRLIVDHVLRFEYLDAEMPILLAKLGIEWTKPLPKENRSKRDRLENYYSEEAIALVQNLFRQDFDLFSYGRELPKLN